MRFTKPSSSSRRHPRCRGAGARTCIRAQAGSRRAPAWHGYILYQLLKLIGREVQAEEFNTLKTLELAITNDRIWQRVCQALGWRFHPTV